MAQRVHGLEPTKELSLAFATWQPKLPKTRHLRKTSLISYSWTVKFLSTFYRFWTVSKANRPPILDLPHLSVAREDPDFEKLQILYDIYRDYMKHEDDLLNQRSTWHLLIQGFLFATLGVIGEWQVAQRGPDPLYTERGFLVYVLAIVGVVIAYAAFVSIKAANDAIDSLEARWLLITGAYERQTKYLLPAIAGGGNPDAKTRGKKPAMWIPVAILCAWVVIFCMSIYDRVSPHPRLDSAPMPANSASPTLTIPPVIAQPSKTK